MSPELYNALILAAIAVGLLIVDRIVRINPFLASEGFQVAGYPVRCGTDLPPCAHPKRCINGFCRGTGQPQLYDRNPLPVVP
jgi:hypothetical protein